MRLTGGIVALLLCVQNTVAPGLTHGVAGTDVAIDAGGHIEGLGIVDTAGGPHQAPQGTAAVRLDAAARRWGMHVEMRGVVGGPFRGGDADVFNLRHAFQNASPSLDFPEAYLAFRGATAELRAGIQRFAFGKLDGVPPTDVVNPRDFHDPLLRDFEDAKLGVPSVMASYFPSDWSAIDLDQLRLDAVYIPLAVPPRLPLVRERWFPPSTTLPHVSVDCAIVGQPIPPCQGQDSFAIGFELATANDAAPVTLSSSGIAIRVGGAWHGVDWAAYHYSGPETAPNARLTAEVMIDLTGQAVLRQDHATMHMTGFDWATTLGSATFRVESAFFQNRHYLRPVEDLVNDILTDPAATNAILTEVLDQGHAAVPLGDLFVGADTVEWGVGIDYYVAGFLPLLQINQTVVLDSEPRLLIGDPDTRLTGVVRKTWWDDRLELDLRSAYAFETGSWFALPRLAYLVGGNLRLRLGYLALGGSRNSLIGQYQRNDEVVLEARVTF